MLLSAIQTSPSPTFSLRPTRNFNQLVRELEISLLQSALVEAHGCQTRAAKQLNLSYRSLRHLLKKYEISAEAYARASSLESPAPS